MKQKPLGGVRKIAEMAGVSIATVDRVLHNRPGVALATKNKIEQIIKKLDYKPNVIASRLASKKIFRFSVLIPKVSADTNFWQGPLQGIKLAEETIREYGVQIELFFFDQEDKQSFKDQASHILENKPDGVLVAPSFVDEAIHFTGLYAKNKIPFILFDSDIPEHEGLCYVGPHLFRSGFLSAQIMNFGLLKNSKILIMKIARKADDYHYISEIEDGFRAYFSYHNLYRKVFNSDVDLVDKLSIDRALEEAFTKHPDLQAVFVPNSRVSLVADCLEKKQKNKIFLLGFDYTRENIDFLEKGIIDVLICHKSREQGYEGVMNLYRHLVLSEKLERNYFMPIDIITKENYEFYKN